MKKRRFSTKQKKTLHLDYGSTLAISLTCVAAYCDTSVGLIGGVTNSSEAYSAFISSNGTPTSISGLPLNGQINGVDLNRFGTGLIGGQDATGGYAAFLSPSRTLNVLNLDLPAGSISSTSINNSGNGLIGGYDGSFNMFAALISPNGTISTLPTSFSGSFIDSTALNDDGIGLIGGEGNTFPYAAYVTSSGVVNPIDTSPLEGGHFIVAINDQGNGIIGGNSTLGPYAAFVTPSSGSPSPLFPLPSGLSSYIRDVAINNSGIGLIGGNDNDGYIYAGYSTPTGTLTPLFNTPDLGQITSVAINNVGTGLIGGYSGSNLYAAFVQPNGLINPLFSEPIAGSINAVAINDAGIGLIGGQLASSGYSALVAPNGALTPLDMTSQNNIISVALRNTLDLTVPQSTGPYSSGFYTQLAASSALQSRIIEQNRVWSKRNAPQINVAQSDCYEKALIAQNFPEISCVEKAEERDKQNTLWIVPFGNYVHLKAEGQIPRFSNEVFGFLLGYDYHDTNYIVGSSAGYAFNHVEYSQHLGRSNLQEEMLSLYGAYYLDHFWFDLALWGGLYQLSNVRHTLSSITSKSSTHGWILSPHIEMASPWAIDNRNRYFIEPFFMLDWINDWQDKYTEHGASGFNLKMKSLYGSLLQSEVGVRFYERFEYKWGDFCLEEKLSYVNQAPFDSKTVNTSFVASASTFPIAVGSTNVQNLGCIQLAGFFRPRNPSYLFGGFTIQAMGNEAFQSYFGNLFMGINF